MRQLELGVGSPPPRGKGTKQPPRRSAQAPGQYLGYSLQTTRLLQILLDGESGATYSLELFEDVGEEQRDGAQSSHSDKEHLDRVIRSPITCGRILEDICQLGRRCRGWNTPSEQDHLRALCFVSKDGSNSGALPQSEAARSGSTCRNRRGPENPLGPCKTELRNQIQARVDPLGPLCDSFLCRERRDDCWNCSKLPARDR